MKWIKSGWGSEYSQIVDYNKFFHMDISGIKPTKNPLLKTATKVINDIRDSYPAPFNLMVSGGVDSQSMLWCWLHSDVPFQAICFQLVDDSGIVYNTHDYETLITFANIYSIPIQFVKFNIFEFLSNNLLNYATQYQCTSPQITAHMAMADSITSGTKILSGNFIPGGLYNYTILGISRYAEIKKNAIPFFLMHDPELAGSLVQYDENRDTISYYQNPFPYNRKVELLKIAGIPIIPQQEKYTGFEKIKDYCDKNMEVTLNDRLKYYQMSSKRNFDILFRYKLTDSIKYQDKIIFKFP